MFALASPLRPLPGARRSLGSERAERASARSAGDTFATLEYLLNRRALANRVGLRSPIEPSGCDGGSGLSPLPASTHACDDHHGWTPDPPAEPLGRCVHRTGDE